MVNLNKLGYKVVNEVYKHLNEKATEIYTNTDFALYFKPGEGYALGSFSGELICYAGMNWKSVNDTIMEWR